MDIGKALTYITEDPRWKEKVAIGTGVVILSSILSVVLIGVVGFLIVLGYMVRLVQNVRDSHPYPMPEWDQWGDDLVRGLKLFVVILIWSLPAILFSIPVSIGGALADGRGAGAFIGTTLLFGGMCLLLLYSLFLAVAQASFTVAFARDEQIGSGLQVREIWDWTQANIGQLIIVALAYIVASIGISLVASIVGTLLCLIGLVVTLPLAQLVIYLFQYNLYGQLAAAYPYPGKPGGSGPVGTPPKPTGPATETGFATGATAGTAAAGASTPSSTGTPPSGFDDNPYAAFGPPEASTSTASTTGIPVDAPVVDDLIQPSGGVAEGSGIEDPISGNEPAGSTEESKPIGDSDESYPDSGIEEKPQS